MNINDAIRAHTDWKLKLQTTAEGRSNERLDPGVVALDNKCGLGQWIYGNGMRDHKEDPTFKELCDAHACFHRSAAKLVEMINRGKTESALGFLNDSQSDFGKHQSRVIRCLMSLRGKVVS